MTFNSLDKEEAFSLDEINKDLDDLKDTVIEQNNTEIENKIISDIQLGSKELGIPDTVVGEYIKLLKDFYAPDKIKDSNISNNLKRKLGLDKLNVDLDYYKGVTLFYIKKLCPNKFEDITDLILSNSILFSLLEPCTPFLSILVLLESEDSDLGIIPDYDENKIGDIVRIIMAQWTITGSAKHSIAKNVIKFIEKYGDLAYEALFFCSSFKGSYIQNGVNAIKHEDLRPRLFRSMEDFSMITQFIESFINEPESINLMSFLIKNPQKLTNLGGKEIKEINLDINSGINFAFRGIIEMVKSRPDLNFPHIGKNGSSGEKLWKQQRENIIKEYENMLRNYISIDFNKQGEGSETQIQEKPFDKIFFTTEYSDPVVTFGTPKYWIKNFTGSKVLDYSVDADKNIKDSHRESVVKNMDLFSFMNIKETQIQGAGIEKEYESLNLWEKILFRGGAKELDKEGYIYRVEFGNLIRENLRIPEKPQKQFFMNGKRINKDTGNSMISGKDMGNIMLSDIEDYTKAHPEEKILVCIEHHGGTNGESGNGWSREDWTKLANLSPNLKIWSTRCHFGAAFSNKDIYKHQSSVSGFSNISVTDSSVGSIINLALKKGLGFNELEIYTRLYYPMSVTPLTENMEYKNAKTGKTQTGKVGLAQNFNENNTSDVHHA